MNIIAQYISKLMLNRKKLDFFKVGNIVKVYNKVIDQGYQKKQSFEGLCIAVRNSTIAKSFTLRRLNKGSIIEKTFFLHSPLIVNIRVLKKINTKKAKIYNTSAIFKKLA